MNQGVCLTSMTRNSKALKVLGLKLREGARAPRECAVARCQKRTKGGRTIWCDEHRAVIRKAQLKVNHATYAKKKAAKKGVKRATKRLAKAA